MKKTELETIYQRFLEGICTEEEVEFLYDHFKAEYEEDLKQLILSALESTDDNPAPDETEVRALANVYSRVKEVTHPSGNGGIFRKPIKIFKYRIAAAAALIICLSFGITLYLVRQAETQSPGRTAKKQTGDIAPGGNKAFLILGNGKRISLVDASAGEIAKEAGMVITKTAEGRLTYTVSETSQNDEEQIVYNTIETPRGGQYQIILPDGTKVWLNAASSLRYPTSFLHSERKVELTGEGYFEVARDVKKPFKVSTYSQDVMVLGTHFNINSYSDEPEVKTTLLEGSVKVASKTSGNSRILVPGQQSLFVGNELKIKEVAADDAVAWKDGYFQFNHSDLKTVMRELSRWYNVTIKYEGNIRPQRFGGAIQRNLHLSQALEILEKSQVHFRIEGKEVVVMP